MDKFLLSFFSHRNKDLHNKNPQVKKVSEMKIKKKWGYNLTFLFLQERFPDNEICLKLFLKSVNRNWYI